MKQQDHRQTSLFDSIGIPAAPAPRPPRRPPQRRKPQGLQPQEAARQTDAAVQAVGNASSHKDKAALRHVILTICQKLPKFSSDDVWVFLERCGMQIEADPRLLGAIIRDAVRSGWCSTTGSPKQSERPERHRGWVMVYNSNLYRSGR